MSLTITLPTIPNKEIIEYQKTISYAAFSGIFSNTANILVVGMPQNYVVCGAAIQIIQQFSGPSLSSFTCSLGAFGIDVNLTNTTFYLTPYELTLVAGPQSFEISGPPSNNFTDAFSGVVPYGPIVGLYFDGPHDINAVFTSTGATLNTVNAGLVNIVLQIRPV